LRSIARRVSLLTQASRGALAKTRGEAAPQSGQAAGSLRWVSARKASKPPQAGQAYS
jgi:hypothetical protein